MRIWIVTSFLLVSGLLPASAQDASPGRYSMQKTDTGIARLDTQTGEVTLCAEKGGELVCRMAADERTAYDLELDLLTRRVEALEKTAEGDVSSFKPRLPTEKEIDEGLGVMERMMRSMLGMARDLARDWQGEVAPPPALESEPQKT